MICEAGMPKPQTSFVRFFKVPALILLLVPVTTTGLADISADCQQLANPDLAVHACTRLLEKLGPRPDLLNRRGIAHLRGGNPREAIEDYSAALQLDSEFMWLHYNRGRAQLVVHNYHEAIFDFTAAIARHPLEALPYNGRAWALFKIGNLPAALEDADHSLALDVTYAAAFDTRAHIYEAAGKRFEAIRDYRRALLLDPQNPLAFHSREGLRRLGESP